MDQDPLYRFPVPFITSQALLGCLAGYKKPRDWIARKVKNGELIRIKNGLFLIAVRIQRGESIPFEQLANILYGPSYVSLESALSYYGGFIPERVVQLTSATLKRDKEFATPLGVGFRYFSLSPDRYAIGIKHKAGSVEKGGFWIATPEKALADLVHFRCQGLDLDELKIDLLEGRRIPVESLKNLDRADLGKITEAYQSKPVVLLNRIVSDL